MVSFACESIANRKDYNICYKPFKSSESLFGLQDSSLNNSYLRDVVEECEGLTSFTQKAVNTNFGVQKQ